MSVVLLADVKSYGKFLESATDTDLQSTIDTAELVAAKWVGPLTSTAVTQRFYDASLSAVLVLNYRPVVSVESVTGSDGALVPLANLDIDLANGIIYPDTTGTRTRWALTRYTVAYHAGYTTTPGDIKLGVIKLVAALWKARRGPLQNSQGVPDIQMMMATSSAALPAEVRLLWDAYMRPGVA